MSANTGATPPQTAVSAPSGPREARTPRLRDGLGYFVRLLLLARPYWRGLLTGIVLGILVGLLGMVPPYLSKLFIDTVYPSHDLSLLNALAIGLLVVTASSGVVSALEFYYSQVVSARLSNAAALLFFNHLQHLPVQFFDEHAVGEIQSRFGDVRSALGTLMNVFESLLGNGIYLVIVPPLLFLMNWRLALVALATAPITGVATALTGRLVRRQWHLTAELNGELAAFQVEVLSHIRTFKTLAGERFLYQAAQARAEAALGRQLRASGATALMVLFNGIARAAGTVVFSWYGWTLVVHDQLSVGAFVAFSAYLGYLTTPITQITGLFTSFQQATVALSRMFEYLDAPVEQDPSLVHESPVLVRRARGEIRVVDLGFGYKPERRVLDGVSLTLAPGNVTAVVGPSGSGKSSLLRLLCRMAAPDEGAILLDGVPLGMMPLAEVRGQITTVWQEVALLRGTIWHNLTIGLDSPAPEAVREVVRICRLDDLLRDLPHGYETEVGEWGAMLSGGQRQRLMIARALLRDTPVLLLDEATSQVDMQTEAQILGDVLDYTRGKTVLFVTHRVTTAALAAQVCVLEAGRVVGLGTHADLAMTCESYKRMLRAASRSEVRHMRDLGAKR